MTNGSRLPFGDQPVKAGLIDDSDRLPDLPADSSPPSEARVPRRPETVFDIAVLGQTDPVEIATRMERFFGALDGLWWKNVQPEDLVLFRSPGGTVSARPKYQAVLELKRIFGIQIKVAGPFDARNIPDPCITKAPNGTILAEIWGHGFCHRTGELVEWVRGARHSEEKFIGRGTRKADGNRVNEDLLLTDLKAAAWVNMVKRIVTMLTGKASLTQAELVKRGIDLTRCAKGFGYGDAGDRGPEAQTGDRPISQKQGSRLWAIACSAAERMGWNDADRNDTLLEVLKGRGVEMNGQDGKPMSLRDVIAGVQVGPYNAICATLDEFKKPAQADDRRTP